MREFQDLVDIFPYCLLVALPIMIFLAPPAVAVGHEFPAHRLAQLELGGVARGPKAAALSMDARAVPSEANVNLLRKTVISRLQGKQNFLLRICNASIGLLCFRHVSDKVH